MKRVVFFVTALNGGGLENYLLRFLSYYRNEIDAIVICKSGYEGKDLVQQYHDIGVNVIPHKLGYFNIFQYYKLYKFLKSKQVESVCDFTGNFAALPLLTAKLAGIPKRIAFFRGSTNHFKESIINLAYNRFMNWLLDKVSTAILSNSKSALNFFFKEKWKSNTKYEVIYNGIDASVFLSTKEDLRNELNIPNSAFVVGHIGRFNQAKNHSTILDVAIAMCKKDKNTYFIMCGKGVDKALRKNINGTNLKSQIKLLGFRNDVIKLLNTFDCFYFPSFSEGQPNALIEALIAGVPFVASNIEPIKETIPIKYHKQLVEPTNVLDALKKIEELKENGDLRKQNELQKWAISNFNPKELFHRFYLEL